MQSVVIVNDGDAAVRQLVLTSVAGPGRIAADGIVPGGAVTLALRAPGCLYRVRAVYENGAVLGGAIVNLCRSRRHRLSQLLRPVPVTVRLRPLPPPTPPPPPPPPPTQPDADDSLPVPPPPPPHAIIVGSTGPPRVDRQFTPEEPGAFAGSTGRPDSAEGSPPPPGEGPPPQAGPAPTPAPTAVAADPVQPCEVLQRLAPKSECDLYGATVAGLRSGSAGLLAPRTMQEGETRTVSLVISRQAGQEQINDLLGAAPTQAFTTKVSGLMAARLSGDGFTIKPLTAEMQQVSAVGGQRWEWSVTALQGPRHELAVSVFVAAKADDPPEKRTLLLTKRYPVDVKVSIGKRSERGMDSMTEWLKHLLQLQNALWAVLTGALSLALWKAIGKWRRRRSRRRPPKAG